MEALGQSRYDVPIPSLSCIRMMLTMKPFTDYLDRGGPVLGLQNYYPWFQWPQGQKQQVQLQFT